MWQRTSNNVEELERGTHSSIDIAPYWVAYSDGTFELACACGRVFEVKPGQGGLQWGHYDNCGYEGLLIFKGWEKLYETASEAKKRRRKEENGDIV